MLNKSLFFKHAAVSFIVRALGATSGFLMNLALVKSLNIHDAGLFFIGLVICNALSVFCTMGFCDAFLRFISASHSCKEWGQIKSIFEFGFVKVLLFSFFISILLFIFSDLISIYIFSKNELSIIISILCFSIPLLALYKIIGFAFQSVQKTIHSISIQNIFHPILVVILLTFIFRDNVTTNQVALIFLFSGGITFFISIFLWLKQKEYKVKRDTFKKELLLRSVRPLWVILSMGLIIQFSGQIITGIYLSPEDVALFSVAQRWAMLASFVLVAVNLIVAPKFSACAHQGNIQELIATSKYSSRLMILLATPVLIVMLIFPAQLLSFFGSDYEQASIYLQILAIGQFINVATGSVGYLLSMTGHENDMKKITVFVGIIAIVLGITLTQFYGALGTSIATAVSLSCQNLLAVYIVKKRIGFNTLNIF